MALKVMVDAWAGALAEQKAIALGATITVYGVALLSGRSYPRWMGAVAVLGGVPTVGGGIAIAYTGFSGLAMSINMPANLLLVVWMLALGVIMRRQPALTTGTTA